MSQAHHRAGTGWWVGTVGYEVYARSYADADGDGIGDLRGIAGKLDHLVWLGVDSVWITPFYPSPGFDHGYDVSDYRDVNVIHGSLADFDDLVEAAHARDLRVIVDIVPNHTSSHHPWFLEARSSRDNPYRDFYIWRDPKPDGSPPNNWMSHFGGPAWSFDDATEQYWCHLFLPEQPDLDWSNPEVRERFDEILRFWCDRGVNGFRVDVAHGLTKHPDLPDNPQLRPVTDDMGSQAVFLSFEHRYDLDQDTNLDIFHRWHEVVEPYGAVLIGEVNAPTPSRMARYTLSGALDTVFFLRPAWSGWDPEELIAMHKEMHAADPSGVSWVLNNHDQARSVSRFGSGEVGVRRSLALTTLQFALGGVPFLYQGEELGLDNAELPPAEREDPIWTRNEVTTEIGRDVARHGMPWTTGHANGFTTGEPWLAATERRREETVEGQLADPDSTLYRYRDLLAVRRAHVELWDAPPEWLTAPTATSVVLRRGSILVVANLGPDPVTCEATGPLAPVFESSAKCASPHGNAVDVDGESTMIAVVGNG